MHFRLEHLAKYLQEKRTERIDLGLVDLADFLNQGDLYVRTSQFPDIKIMLS